MLVKISGGQRSGLVLGCSAFTPLDGIRLLTNMPWTSTAALPTGLTAQPPGNAGATPLLPAAPLLSRSLMNSWAFLSQHCDRSAPALRRACKGSLHQNALWLLIGSRRRKVALNAALWRSKVRSGARRAPPLRACVQQERSAIQLWFGRAVPLGVASEPAVHARPALPYWANSVGTRGPACRGILSQPPTGAAALFSPAGECLVIVAKPSERLQGES